MVQKYFMPQKRFIRERRISDDRKEKIRLMTQTQRDLALVMIIAQLESYESFSKILNEIFKIVETY